MKETSKRLRETSNLLKELKNSSHDRDNFRTKLNAFISSARTITFVMQTEFHQISGFTHWYELKQMEMRENELFKYFVEKRNNIQKKGSVRINVKATTQSVTDVNGKSLLNLGIEKNGQIETVNKDWNIVSSFKDRPNDDAIDLCERYFKELEKISIECVQKFSLNSKSQ